MKGPLLLACNHPNSFLDGIVLTTLFSEPIYSLARGDAFRIKWVDRFLRKMKLLPVYRTSEGTENLGLNYTTFAACRDTFRANGIVLIFSEGRCENEWHLRPLKKGTARLAITSWKEGIPLKILPVALNYSTFNGFSKAIHIFFGEEISSDAIPLQESDGRQLNCFNAQLKHQLEQMVYEISPGDINEVVKRFDIHIKPYFYLFLPFAVLGWLLHAPLYYPAKVVAAKFHGTGHYDSVLHSLLLLLYPFYCVILTGLACFISPWFSLTMIVLPFTAWCLSHVKIQSGLGLKRKGPATAGPVS